MSDVCVERRKNMINIMSQNEEFIIIGLTGRIGSGCTETAKILASNFQQLELPWIQPGTKGLRDNDEREKRILQRYAGSHWVKFDIIRTRTILSCYLLDVMEDFLSKITKKIRTNDEKNMETMENEDPKTIFYDKVQSVVNNIIKNEIGDKVINNGKIDVVVWVEELIKSLNKMKTSCSQDNILEFNKLENIFELIIKEKDEGEFLEYCCNLSDILGTLYQVPDKTDNGKSICERGKFIQLVEDALAYISRIAAIYILQQMTSNEILDSLKNIYNSLEGNNDTDGVDNKDKEKESIITYKKFVFVHDIADILSNVIYDLIDESDYSYTELYQKYGNSIRCYGRIYLEEPDNDEVEELNIFSIPRKIVQFIKILRHPFSNGCVRPVRIAIDSIKSVFEAEYLRQRYSSFYLFAISTDNEIRKHRLMDGDNKNLTMQQIRFADWNEYSSEGYKIFKSDTESDDEKVFKERIKNIDDSFVHDYVRKYAYENRLHQFYLQDVAASIENADIFISNRYNNTISKNMELRWSIVRSICLILFPGLLLPTPIERCMQIAFAAKCNSGCLSRQVGAVVTDKEYNILSIGWNDVPCGDISCSHKNLVDLCKWEDKAAYSNYELENPEFRERLKRFKHQNVSKYLLGLPMRYCFKDIHTDERNSMRSRAMHAEEKALALCGESCKEGYLFTTSSPCEMCSKNAKNHKIKKIYYIELYPGISESQYTNSGDPNNIAEHILFTGAIGRAYTKMYTPSMPQKDIIDMLGVNEKCGLNFKK